QRGGNRPGRSRMARAPGRLPERAAALPDPAICQSGAQSVSSGVRARALKPARPIERSNLLRAAPLTHRSSPYHKAAPSERTPARKACVIYAIYGDRPAAQPCLVVPLGFTLFLTRASEIERAPELSKQAGLPWNR